MRRSPGLTYLGRMTTATSAGLVPSWTVGDRLRKARETTGLDAETFADEIGVHRDTVSNYEKGRTKRHSRAVLNQWVMRTGVSLTWIKTGETAPSTGGPGGGQEIPHPRRRSTDTGNDSIGDSRRTSALRVAA